LHLHGNGRKLNTPQKRGRDSVSTLKICHLTARLDPFESNLRSSTWKYTGKCVHIWAGDSLPPAASPLQTPSQKTKIANWPLVTCTIIGFSGASNYAEQGKKFSEVRVRCQEPNGTCLSLRPQPQPTQSTTDLKKEKKKTIHHSSVYHNFNLTKIRTNGNEIVLHAVLHRQVEHTRIKDDQL